MATDPSLETKSGDEPVAQVQVSAREGDNSSVPKPKRLACMICRKRKLKCDGIKPSCSTCTRLGHSCAYDEVRRKSGPKRGYVKALEERLSPSAPQIPPCSSSLLASLPPILERSDGDMQDS